MGSTSSGHLFYGYTLGGGEAGWYVAEADEDGQWTPPWLSGEPDDLDEAIMHRLVAHLGGFTEPDPYPNIYDGDRSYEQIRGTPEYAARLEWSSRKSEAWRNLGIDLERVGGYDSRELVLTIAEHERPESQLSTGVNWSAGPVTVRGFRRSFPFSVDWADTLRLDFAKLEEQREALGWDERLDAAVKALQFTPVEVDGYYWQADITRTPVGPGWILGASYG